MHDPIWSFTRLFRFEMDMNYYGDVIWRWDAVDTHIAKSRHSHRAAGREGGGSVVSSRILPKDDEERREERRSL